MFISPHIKELYLLLDVNQRQKIDFEIGYFVGHNQRVVQDKLKGKRPFYSLAEKQNYEAKFDEVYLLLLEPAMP